MKVNFDAEMEKIISQNAGKDKKKLLLHACCAPCSSACIERLKEHFDLTVYFYNPNMDTLAEYEHRYSEQERLCKALNVNFVGTGYNCEQFYSAVNGLEKEKEGGARCSKCFSLRLEKTAKYALENGYDYFTTTLTVSPKKNADVLNAIGYQVASKIGVAFLPSDFKKKNGYIRSIELSKEYQLYRQNYCGCVYSKTEKND